MREFFIAQMDYIYFLYGLAFILLAVTTYFIFRAKPAQAFWKWLALFGLIHGANEWLDMLALSLGDSYTFKMARIIFLTASFLCFIEIVRAEARKRRGGIFGPWVYVPLLSVTLGAGWMLDGLTGVNILSRYIFGVIGGLLASAAIMTSSAGQERKGKDRSLAVFAWLLGSYAATQFFTPKGTFLPASSINQDAFFSLLGFPVQLLRMVLAGLLAGLAWKEYVRKRFNVFSGGEAGSSFMNMIWLPAGLVVILLAGWIMTAAVGLERNKEEQGDLLNQARIAAAMIDPARVKTLSGTPEDLGNDDYKRIQRQLLDILQGQTDMFYMYLFGRKDEKTIFLIDVERPGRKASPLPVAVPGEVYEEDADLLGRIFSSGGAVTVGPEKDKWGTFISGLAAISDPADGKIIAVLGIDYDAKEWALMIDRHRLLPILLIVLITILFIVFFVIFTFGRENEWDVQARESEKKGLLRDLGERMTELTCLSSLSNLINKYRDEEEFFVRLIKLIPTAYRFPGIIRVRIVVEGKEFKSGGFRETEWKQTAVIKVNGEKAGFIEACLLEYKTEESSDVGLLETERYVLEMIAERVGQFIERKHSEATLRNSENRYRALFESSRDAIMTIEPPSWIFTSANKAMVDMFKAKDESEICSHEPWRLSPVRQPDGRHSDEKAMEMIEIAVRDGYNFFEWTHKRLDGEEFPAVVLLSRTALGEKTIIQAMVRDVTESKKAERALRESEQKLKIFADFTVGWEYWLDPEGKVVYMSPSVKDITGYSSDELVNGPSWLAKIIHPDSKSVIEMMAGRGRVVSLEFRIITKSGQTRWVSYLSNGVTDDQGRDMGLRVSINDITVRKKVEEELRHARVQADMANQTKSQFLAHISHEIRTPLNAVIGFAEMLEGTPLSDVQKDYSNVIRTSGENLIALIGDILDISKIEAKQLTFEEIDFDLENMVESVIHMIMPKMKNSRVELEYEFAPDVPRNVNGDPTRLRQVLLNLLVNAVKFTEKGEIRLSVSLDPQDTEGRTVRFSVKDTGIGIPKEKQEAIFERFVQADASTTRKYGGAGLGLSISKSLLELMGGDLSLISEPGKGSEFIVTLRLNRSSFAIGEGMMPISYGQLEGKKIVVIGESEKERRSIEDYCKDAKMEILYSGPSGEEAIQNNCGRSGIPHVIIYRAMMSPDTGGREFVKKVRSRDDLKGAKLVVVDPSAVPGAAKSAREAGFDAYISKPVLRQNFIKIIQTVLGVGRAEGRIVTAHMAEELSCKGIKVLIAEDIPASQKLMSLILKRFGCETDIVSNGKEAVEKLKKGAYDIVLMDVQMPVMDGIEATKAIRDEVSRTLPIIALTAAAMGDDKKKSMDAGMNDYLTKPIKAGELKKKLLAWTGRGGGDILISNDGTRVTV